ncbi:MAG: DUF4041 domain-containing protein [Ruminococcus flavefaciens]|nr:DUF4041 domain-containing protein [Ruminococcus flavefaciens]
MSLFGISEKKEIERLKAQLTPEQQSLDVLNQKIQAAKAELASLQQQIIETDEAALLQSFGIYTPHYSYTTSDEYKAKLKELRDRQKAAVKNGQAVAGNENWRVNGSPPQGKKMVRDMQKLLLRAYNAECDDAIEHVRFNNIEACTKKINASADAISKLGAIMGIYITNTYVYMKIEELRLMHEYQVKKQEEKEAAREARQRQREEAKAMKELEEARKKLEKEQSHYQNALTKLNNQLKNASAEARQALEEKKAELAGKLLEIETDIKDVDYRAANQRAGYVYIISNIGAFGEGIYKIGMTRRLDPMERVYELGDASVPFNFDVHAMIFTEDAPGLEAALHSAFSDRKLNFVNQRREFFRVSLDEIKEVVKKNYDKTVEFVDIPPAEQYRESIKLRESNLYT